MLIVLMSCITVEQAAMLFGRIGCERCSLYHKESFVGRIYPAAGSEHHEPSATAGQRALTWAQRLKRVFAIDIETCRQDRCIATRYRTRRLT
jgi:hypothetical protein